MTSPRFTDFARAVLARRLIRPGTLTDYQRLLGYAGARLGALPVSRICPAHIQECLADARGQGLGEKSCKNLLSLIRSIIREAGSTAADGLKVRAPAPDIRALTETEAGRLRTALEEDPDGAPLLVLLGTALRRGELLALTVEDWLADACQLRVARSASGPTKSGQARTVDVPDWLAPVLRRAACHRGHLFPTTYPRKLRETLRRACQAAGVPVIRIHDLRHARITHLLLQGVPPLYVSQQAGHHSPAFTLAVYGHLAAASPAQRSTWCNA